MTKKKEEKMPVVQEEGEAAEIAPIQAVSAYQQQQASVEKMIMQAITSGVPIETMERVLAMRTQLKEEFAKEQFDIAMSGFQSECPIIKRIKDGSRTKAGELAFKYAPLEVIIKETQPIMQKYGLSYTFKPIKNDAGKLIDVRCYAKHVNGYSDYSEMPVTEGGGTSLMSGSQISAASITFAKRYAFCNIFGIVTENEDDEKRLASEASKPAVNDPDRITRVSDMIKQSGLVEKKILGKFKVDRIDQLDERSLLILEKSLAERIQKNAELPTIQA